MQRTFSSWSRYAGRRRPLNERETQELVSQAVGGAGLRTIVVAQNADTPSVIAGAPAGACICFAPGTFVFSGTIIIDKRMTIDGCGAILRRADGFDGPIFDVRADQVVITGICFEGNVIDTATKPVIVLTDTIGVDVGPCEFNNCGVYAVEELGTSDYSTVANSNFA